MTQTFTIEYRDHTKGETVLFETDELGPAELVLAATRTSGKYRTLISFDLGTRPCRGYGEECGTPVKHHGDSDLCPDCTVARMDAQSPRIPA